MGKQRPLKGVNLGGWLVVERWITPSLFAGANARNEYQLSQTRQGTKRLQRHRQEFVTEDDLAWLAKNDVELLRVPVGYWIFGDASPYIGALERLDWLVRIAKKYNLHLLLCLHGAPGAQNAAEHSGSGNQSHDLAWLKNKPVQEQTIDVLCRLADRYRKDTNIWGIELLNEPAVDRWALRLAQFHRRAYRRMIQHARPGTHVVFSDAFRPWLTTNTFWLARRRDFPVVLDRHLYYCFGLGSKRRTFVGQLNAVARSVRTLGLLARMQPVMIGEWSAMLPYKVSPEDTQEFISHQQKAYRQAVASCYWTYKTEAPGRWNYRWMVENDHSI